MEKLNSGVAFGFLAGVLAVGVEAAMKRPGFQWAPNLCWLIGPAILLNYCIYRLVQGSPSLAAAFVVFTFASLSLRVGLSVWLGHPIGLGTWIAVVLIAIAFLLSVWKP